VNHPANVTLVSGGGEFICAFDPQYFGVFKERLFELLGEFRQRYFGFARAADRLVVDVGDVHHPMHLVTAQLQMTLKQIFEDVSAKISDVCAAVDSRSASVDTDRPRGRIARLELFDLARVGVKQADWHLPSRLSSRAGRGIPQKDRTFSHDPNVLAPTERWFAS